MGVAKLDTATPPTGKVTISFVGGLSLSGFVTIGGVAYDVTHVQLVGGAGGLSKIMTPAAYQNAQLADPLSAIMKQSGESQSATISAALLSVQLPYWSIVASTAARAIDELCGAAAAALGTAVTWRVLGDGTIWIGSETWPAQSMPVGSDLLDAFPAGGRFVIGADTPWLLPGVALSGVGNVGAVDHFFDSHEVRSWAWV
jgi:hypothetical protein